jgi:hypothetical protein
VQRATAQSKPGIFRDYGVAEAPPGFQAGWSDCMTEKSNIEREGYNRCAFSFRKIQGSLYY